MTKTTMEPKSSVEIVVRDEHGNVKSSSRTAVAFNNDMITGMTSYGRQNVAAFVGTGTSGNAAVAPTFMGLGSSQWPVSGGRDTNRSYQIFDLNTPLLKASSEDEVADYVLMDIDATNPVQDPDGPDLTVTDDTRDTAHFTAEFKGADYLPLYHATEPGVTTIEVTEAALFTTAKLLAGSATLADPGMFAYAIVPPYNFYLRDTITVNWYLSFPWNYICDPTDKDDIE